MKSLAISAIAFLSLALNVQAAEYVIDPGHTEVRFYYSHAGVTDQSGEWGNVSGTVNFDEGNIEATSANITIAADSISTGIAKLDEELKASEFFDAEKFPKITFVSTGIERTGDKTVALTGDMTIKGKTKSVTFNMELTLNGKHPVGKFVEYYQGDWIAAHGEGKILRSDFGLEKFVPLTSDEVKITIATELRAGGWN